MLYEQLKNTLQPQDAPDWKQELADYEALIPAGVAAVKAQQAGRNTTRPSSTPSSTTSNSSTTCPSSNRRSSCRRKILRRLAARGDGLLNAAKGEKISPAIHGYATMADAFKKGDAAAFNAALADYRASLVPDFSPALHKARAEVFFNQMQPFYAAMVIYVIAGLLGVCSWFNLSETLRRSAVWLIGWRLSSTRPA
jgi:hypothetical protein